MIVVALAAEHVYAFGDNAADAATPVYASSETVRIPLAEVTGGELHRFRFVHERTTVRFLVIQKADGTLFTGLEACTICGGGVISPYSVAFAYSSSV